MASRLRRLATELIHSDNLDLYLLVSAAAVFTVLGATGVTGLGVLSSMTMGALAALAYSQVRTRRHLAELTAWRRTKSAVVLGDKFPEDLIARRAAAREFLFVGVSMYRTLPGLRDELPRMLREGSRVRVLLVDPTDDALMRDAATRLAWLRDSEHLAGRIRSSLSELESLQTEVGSGLEVRVSSVVPAVGINLIDADSPGGVIVVQHYEYRAAGEPSPIMRLTIDDGYWYQHFAREAERMWTHGTDWPPDPDTRHLGFAHPAFVEDFDEEMGSRLSTARQLLITGVARNTLITSRYEQLERCLRRGAAVRFLLVDPNSAAVNVAADRYYAVRSVEDLSQRIRQSLRSLSHLKQSTGGDLRVGLTSYPLAFGTVAVDATGEAVGPGSTLFLEYFNYQVAGQPKFVLLPHDGRAFEQFLGEAELLWAGATPYPLDAQPQTPR
jgi:hypothetical protein